jgi:hypothetical protein
VYAPPASSWRSWSARARADVHLAADYIYPTPRGGRCRVRIFLPEEPDRDAPVVVCTELPSNPGQSVTNAAEQIAAEVIRAHLLPTPLVWIEHYPPESTNRETETFDLVIFSSYAITERATTTPAKPAPTTFLTCLESKGSLRRVLLPSGSSLPPFLTLSFRPPVALIILADDDEFQMNVGRGNGAKCRTSLGEGVYTASCISIQHHKM